LQLGKFILHEELELEQRWQSFNAEHELTTKGIEKFVSDYPITLFQWQVEK